MKLLIKILLLNANSLLEYGENIWGNYEINDCDEMNISFIKRGLSIALRDKISWEFYLNNECTKHIVIPFSILENSIIEFHISNVTEEIK